MGGRFISEALLFWQSCILYLYPGGHSNSGTTAQAFYYESLFSFSSFSFPFLIICLICGKGERGDEEEKSQTGTLFFPSVCLLVLSN